MKLKLSVPVALAVVFLASGALAQPEVPAEPAPAEPAGEEQPAPPSAPAAEPGSGETSEMERRLDVLAAELEKLRLGEVAPRAEGGVHGLGPAASKVYRTEQGVSLGGYGEVLYRNFADPAKQDAFDFQRAILYVGYKFSDKFVLNTEIEIEHVKEIFLEFAYIDYLWSPALSFRGGLLLLPMGLINELHEPTVFLGAVRPEVEQRILPSTWRENGLGVFGEVGPISYRAYLVNGLKGSAFTAQGLRGGRQKGGEALASDMAGVVRVDYTGTPGLLVGASAYLGDSGQQLDVRVPTTIVEAHVDFKWRGLELRGLWAQAMLENVAALNGELSLAGSASVGEAMQGYYAQVGFDALTLVSGSEMSLIPFVRWEDINTQLRVPSGFAASTSTANQILTLGASFQPIPQVVVKAELQRRFSGGGTATSQTNALLGYIF